MVQLDVMKCNMKALNRLNTSNVMVQLNNVDNYIQFKKEFKYI